MIWGPWYWSGTFGRQMNPLCSTKSPTKPPPQKLTSPHARSPIGFHPLRRSNKTTANFALWRWATRCLCAEVRDMELSFSMSFRCASLAPRTVAQTCHLILLLLTGPLFWGHHASHHCKLETEGNQTDRLMTYPAHSFCNTCWSRSAFGSLGSSTAQVWLLNLDFCPY
jgi:hypothetical protein